MFVKRTMGSVPRPVDRRPRSGYIDTNRYAHTDTRAHRIARSLARVHVYIQRGTRLVSALWLPSMSMGGFECA